MGLTAFCLSRAPLPLKGGKSVGAQETALSPLIPCSFRSTPRFASVRRGVSGLSRSHRNLPRCAIGEADFEEIRNFEPTPNTPFATDTRIVQIRRPLGLRLKEVKDDQGGLVPVVYVAEVVPGGNAESAGNVSQGDVVTGCSIPYGDALVNIGGITGRGVAFVESQMKTRADEEEYFFLALRSYEGGPEVLQAVVAADEANAARTSIDWQPTMAAIKNPSDFVVLSSEESEMMAAKEADELKKNLPPIPEETERLEDDALYQVSSDVEEMLEKRLREVQMRMEEAELDDL